MKFAVKIIKALSAVLNIGLFGLVVYFMLKSQQNAGENYSFLLNISLLLFVAAVLISALVFISYDTHTADKTKNEQKEKTQQPFFERPQVDFTELNRKIAAVSDEVNRILSNNMRYLNNKLEEMSKNKSSQADFSEQNKLLKDVNDRIEKIAERQDALNKNFNVVLKHLESSKNKKGKDAYSKAPEEIKYPESALKMKDVRNMAAKTVATSTNMPSAEEKRSFIVQSDNYSDKKSAEKETDDTISAEEAEKQLKKIFNDDLAAQLADLDILKEENKNSSAPEYDDIDIDTYLNNQKK